MGYSDLYVWFPQVGGSVEAGTSQTFTVQGMSLILSYGDNVVTAIPAGASVTVYDANGIALPALSTATDETGSFVLAFPAAGRYTVAVGGTCSYTCPGFDGTPLTYSAAPVTPARCAVQVTGGADEPVSDQTVTASSQTTTMSGQTATAAALPFLDVTPEDFFYDAVRWATARGITSGAAADAFAPEAGCTRGQMVTFLHRALRPQSRVAAQGAVMWDLQIPPSWVH